MTGPHVTGPDPAGAPPVLTIALQSDKAPGEYARLAALVEQHGIGGVSIYADLGYQPPLPGLLEAAAATERLEVGPACLNPFLTHPVEIAGQIAFLDAASGGRAYLGVARGSWLGQVGVAQERPLAALRDTVAIVDRLLAGDASGYTGRAYSINPGFALVTPRLRPRVPVLLGVWGARGAALAAEIADRVKIGGSANPDMAAWMGARLDEAAASLDAKGTPRRAERVTIGIGAVTVVDEDGEAARALARREVAMYLDVVGPLDPTVEIDPELLDRLRVALADQDLDTASGLVGDDLLDRFAMAGTPEQVGDHVLRLLDAGADSVELGTPHGLDSEVGLRLIGERLAPIVRQARSSS